MKNASESDYVYTLQGLVESKQYKAAPADRWVPLPRAAYPLPADIDQWDLTRMTQEFAKLKRWSDLELEKKARMIEELTRELKQHKQQYAALLQERNNLHLEFHKPNQQKGRSVPRTTATYAEVEDVGLVADVGKDDDNKDADVIELEEKKPKQPVAAPKGRDPAAGKWTDRGRGGRNKQGTHNQEPTPTVEPTANASSSSSTAATAASEHGAGGNETQEEVEDTTPAARTRATNRVKLNVETAAAESNMQAAEKEANLKFHKRYRDTFERLLSEMVDEKKHKPEKEWKHPALIIAAYGNNHTSKLLNRSDLAHWRCRAAVYRTLEGNSDRPEKQLSFARMRERQVPLADLIFENEKVTIKGGGGGGFSPNNADTAFIKSVFKLWESSTSSSE